ARANGRPHLLPDLGSRGSWPPHSWAPPAVDRRTGCPMADTAQGMASVPRPGRCLMLPSPSRPADRLSASVKRITQSSEGFEVYNFGPPDLRPTMVLNRTGARRLWFHALDRPSAVIHMVNQPRFPASRRRSRP